jgi:hypothetical protein
MKLPKHHSSNPTIAVLLEYGIEPTLDAWLDFNGVSNVYGDLGQIFAWTAVAEPRLAAALMGMLVKGLRTDCDQRSRGAGLIETLNVHGRVAQA